MRLILMRHAKAMTRDPHIFRDDSLRPLSEKGIKEHKKISKVLLDMGVMFDRILTSPYKRAKETARITRKVYGSEEKMEKVDELADRFSVEGLLGRLQRYKVGETILLVGHEPHMGILANALLRPEMSMDIDFKKSGVMCIGFDKRPARGRGTLEYFLKPRLLRNLKAKKKDLGPRPATGKKKRKA